jgi:hypothetical protein
LWGWQCDDAIFIKALGSRVCIMQDGEVALPANPF